MCRVSPIAREEKTPLREKVLWAIVKTASPTNDSMGLGLLECSTEPFEAKSHTASDSYHQNMLNQMCNLIYRNWNSFWPFLYVYYSIVNKIPRPAWRARKEMIINAPHCHSKTLNTPSSQSFNELENLEPSFKLRLQMSAKHRTH